MRIGKKDITAFIVLFLGTIVCVRYFYKHMNDEQFVATVDPYSLVVPSPTAIFAHQSSSCIREDDTTHGEYTQGVLRSYARYFPFFNTAKSGITVFPNRLLSTRGCLVLPLWIVIRQSVFSSNWTSLSLFRPSNERKPPFLLDIILMLISIF